MAGAWMLTDTMDGMDLPKRLLLSMLSTGSMPSVIAYRPAPIVLPLDAINVRVQLTRCK